jgi:hypothetical protein
VTFGARFCKKCGTAIGPKKAAASTTVSSTKSQIIVAADGAASEANEGERKAVTALYAVLTGTTKLMEELDPEEAYAIINPALRLMIDAVHQSMLNIAEILVRISPSKLNSSSTTKHGTQQKAGGRGLPARTASNRLARSRVVRSSK